MPGFRPDNRSLAGVSEAPGAVVRWVRAVHAMAVAARDIDATRRRVLAARMTLKRKRGTPARAAAAASAARARQLLPPSSPSPAALFWMQQSELAKLQRAAAVADAAYRKILRERQAVEDAAAEARAMTTRAETVLDCVARGLPLDNLLSNATAELVV